MTSVFSQSNELLQQLWSTHNPQGEEYLGKEKVVEWAKVALQQTNTMENVEQSMTDLDRLVSQYLEEVHQVNEENVQSLSLNYTEAVDFLRWLTETGKEPEDIGRPQEEQQPVQPEKQEQMEQEERSPLEHSRNLHETNEEREEQQRSFHQQPQYSPQVKNESMKNSRANHIEDLALENKSKKYHQDEPVHQHKKMKTDVQEQKVHVEPFQQVSDRYNSKQDEQINENVTNGPNQFNLQYITKKYKDYLKVIFEHYCKISYATGQDPTFQQIMHKTTIMTINKFMMFCKDFEISKISPLVTRAFLIEIFKKNSECYKEMSVEQFVEVIHKLSNVAYSELNKEAKDPKEKESQLLTEEVVKLLDFLEISTAKKFKDKMKRLNIQYRSGPKTNAELKVVPQGYRFKFVSNNGKSEEQMKQEVNERKIHRSERRILLQDKANLNQNEVNQSLNKRSADAKRNIINYAAEKKNPQPKEGTQSVQAINKILTPPMPPIKKPPNATVRTHVTHVTNTSHPINANQPVVSIAASVNNDSFKKDLSYAQLHKMKMSEGYSRKKLASNHSKSKDAKGSFKLNSIVQQARLQVMQQHHGYPVADRQNLTQSIATNSREQTQRLKAYDISKINNKMQLINDKLKRDREVQQELTNVLDMSNEQQDEFLKEHLERQKKNDIIGKRLSNRINELEYKL